MNCSLRLIAFLFVLSGLVTASAQTAKDAIANGAIVSQKPCTFGSYEQQSAFTKKYYSKQEYDSASSNSQGECFKIEYGSDGLRVVGYLVRPRPSTAKKFPLIIFNRGGFLDRGKIEPFNLVDFEVLSEQGFVVLASQYRGNDGGEGREELGGADLDDVSNLLETAKSLPYIDTRNVFMCGVSRGGMMTFLAMKKRFPMNAAAVVGAVYDLAAFGERAPSVLAEATKLIPNYSKTGVSALRERSVMDWPEAVNVPLLMIHGSDDDEVPVTESLNFAIKLSNLKTIYELMVYAGDVHEAAENRKDRDARITTWFKRYLR
jgi:dipeptidyl aminopeptidase/acylaminoacyl peptidase